MPADSRPCPSVAGLARNNAAWCDAVCRSHGFAGVFGRAAWSSVRRAPTYYPDVVTLRADARAGDLLRLVDTDSPGCAVKDSFGVLDLAPHGFVEWFSARWIHRAPTGPPGSAPVGLHVADVRSTGALRAWQRAWHGPGAEVPDVFRTGLLTEPGVRVLAVHEPPASGSLLAGGSALISPPGGASPAGPLVGGAVLHLDGGLVGVSNLFAAGDPAPVWTVVADAAAVRFPGLPLVGYESGPDLAPALAAGFREVGTLRVWGRTAG